jgi:hypothetical protein
LSSSGSHGAALGNLYKVPLRASGKRRITVTAVAVDSINTGLAATCPHDITWRFLQSRGKLAYELHQSSKPMDLCIGMDYTFLQPKYLEAEMYGKLLHFYTSVFRYGFILLGVELPKPVEAVETSLVAVEAEETARSLGEAAKASPGGQETTVDALDEAEANLVAFKAALS